MLLAYSSRKPLGLVPHPHSASPKGKRVEVRFPRSVGQSVPRLRGDADGRHRRHPEQDPSGRPDGKNLYDLPPEELTKVPTVAGSLREALNALDADRTFLTKGGVFTDDQIDATWSSSGKRSTIGNTSRRRSSTRCTTRSERASEIDGKGTFGSPFFLCAADTTVSGSVRYCLFPRERRARHVPPPKTPRSVTSTSAGTPPSRARTLPA